MDSGVKTVKDLTPQVLAAIRALANTRVMVGIPAENAFRAPEPGETATPPNNAELGYINEFGEPASHIPPRPFLVPAMVEMQPELIRRLHKIADAAVAGRTEGVTKGFMDLGKTCASAVKRKITDGPFKPLADYTVWRRANRRRGKRKGARIELARRAAGEAPSTEFTKPLIDFGHLRRAITFAIRNIRNSR